MALNPSAAPTGLNEYANPYYDGQAITVGTPFTSCRGIYIGGAGNLTVTLLSGNSITFNGALAGTILNIAATNVSAATATNMVALY